VAGTPLEALRFGQLALQRTPPERNADIPRMRALTAVGLAWLDLGRPDEAIGSLEQALRLSQQMQSHASPDRTDILAGLELAQRLAD
jgi:tetratricopeptide (TPR) repeat protein